MIRRPPEHLCRLYRRLREAPPAPPRRPVWRDTSIERHVAGWLDALGIEYLPQHPLTPGYTVDFYVPAAQLAVECHGSYYHASPHRYPGRRTAEQERKQRHDAATARLAAAAGWRRLVLWEEDITGRPEWCRERLRRAVLEESMSERIVSHRLPSGMRLSIHHGDICAERVDAIVNAANSRLQHGGGVAGAIVRRGGQVIQEVSDAHVRRFGEVPCGQATFTTAGELPCQMVIHTVGPVWRGGHQGEPELLREATHSALMIAGMECCESVALPAVSSGVFGFPKPLCARIMVGEAVDWAAEHPRAPLVEIRFCHIDEETVEVFRAEFARRFGEPDV